MIFLEEQFCRLQNTKKAEADLLTSQIKINSLELIFFLWLKTKSRKQQEPKIGWYT